jgi:hypothetical protein
MATPTTSTPLSPTAPLTWCWFKKFSILAKMFPLFFITILRMIFNQKLQTQFIWQKQSYLLPWSQSYYFLVYIYKASGVVG